MQATSPCARPRNCSGARQRLALRRSDCDEAEAERTVAFDELQALLHGQRIADEAHRRNVLAQVGQPVAGAQLRGLLDGGAHEHDAIVSLHHLAEQPLGHVATGTAAHPCAQKRPEQQRQETAVHEHEGGVAVDLAEVRMIVQPDDMVGVGRYYVAEPVGTEVARDVEKGFDIEVVDTDF